MSTDLLNAARALRSKIDANAAKAGSAPVPAETISLLKEANLFGVMTPKEVGGSEYPITDVLDVFSEVSRANGSAGWCLMASASIVAYYGAYGCDDFAEEFFKGGIPLAAGQFAPNGLGTPEGKGYRVSGNYQFGSGIHYADWVGTGFIVPPPDGSDEPARYLFGILPKANAQLKGNWDVLGLQSTSSQDYSLTNVLVPENATFLFAAPEHRRGGSLYKLGVIALTAAGHAGFAMGVARRALDELMAISKTKVRMGGTSVLKDSEHFLMQLGILESRLGGACAWVRETFTAMEKDIVENGEINIELINTVRQATVFVTQEGAEISRQAYLLAGTSALRNSPLQTCFRDLHAGSQHFFASPASTLDMARNLMANAKESGVDF